MNSYQSISFLLVVTHRSSPVFYSVNVKRQHLQVFHPKNKYENQPNLLKNNDFIQNYSAKAARSLIISMCFIFLIFITLILITLIQYLP